MHFPSTASVTVEHCFDTETALEALHALSQQTRLDIFRLLVRHEPEGLPAGAIAQALNVPQNTISSHVAVLYRAQLVTSVRHGRSIIYRAHIAGMRCLVTFLLTDCCDNHPELCDLTAVLTSATLNTQPPN